MINNNSVQHDQLSNWPERMAAANKKVQEMNQWFIDNTPVTDDACEICGASPMTANCNNANCDKGDN